VKKGKYKLIITERLKERDQRLYAI